ncbi:nuclear transport factor 2 family protein [Candidatus Nitrosopelagicus sp.]|nr:nuclear transport factor 2 family protein [Candidatus Nitrosopelagicus sp.]
MSDSITSELLQKWVDTIKNGDANQVTLLYDKRALLLGTFSPKERVGHNAISEYFVHLLKNPVSVEIVSENPYAWDTVAVNSGLYNFVLPNETITARFSFVYGRNGELWKIISHHSSVLPKEN